MLTLSKQYNEAVWFNQICDSCVIVFQQICYVDSAIENEDINVSTAFKFVKNFTAQEKSAIQTFIENDPAENPWVNGKPQPEIIEVLPYDEQWSQIYLTQKKLILAELGNTILSIEHIGSTSVPNLSAKLVIDIDLIVEDPNQEDLYVSKLHKLGYDLTVREPSWYGHRMLRLDAPRVNLHIFPPMCPEHWRHLLFKEWLMNHPDDLFLYCKAKEEAQNQVENSHEYNGKKQPVIHKIYQKIFLNL